ncbi:MAG TPA: insulinase family protein, partial [Limnochordales bacterium]
HPVRLEIGGTVESIREIRPEMLYLCHRTFYRPDNAALAVVGDVEPQAVLELADRWMGAGPAGKPLPLPRREYPQEPPTVKTARAERSLAVSRPRLLVGIKDVPARRQGRELVRRDLALNIALEAALGKGSDAFVALYEQGLVDDGFSARYMGETCYGHSLIGGETPDPARLEERVRQVLERVAREGVQEEDFQRLKRRELGEFVAAMDTPEMLANSLITLHFRDTWPGEYLEVLGSLTREDVNRMLREHVDPSRMAVSVVLPAA